MKSILKIILLLVVAVTLFNCDNDDNDAPNTNVCNYQGVTIEDANGNVYTQIAASDLQTDYFHNNDGPGLAAVEVWDTTVPGQTFIVTRALTVGAVDTNPEIRINNIDYSGTITCQRAGSLVGEELRLDVVVNSLGEGEVCVTIDYVAP